jgi:hypothetical protein
MINKNKEQMGFSDGYVEKRIRKNIFFYCCPLNIKKRVKKSGLIQHNRVSLLGLILHWKNKK